MFKCNFLSGGLILLCSPWLIAANPEPSAGIEAVSDSSEAGDRRSNNNLYLVMDTVTAPAATVQLINPQDIEDDYPHWSGNGLQNPQNGDLSVDWESRLNSTITAALDSDTSRSVQITTVDRHAQSFSIDMEPGGKLDKFVENTNKVIGKLSKGSKQLEAGGSLSVSWENVDYYDDGEKVGIKIEGEGAGSATFPEMDLDVDVPTPIPGIQFEVELGMEETGITLGCTGGYDESKNPPGTFVASASIGTTLSLEAGLEAGIDDVSEIDIDIGGSIFLGAQIDAGYESDEIYYQGSVGIDNVTIYFTGTVTFLGGEFEIFNFSHEFEDVKGKYEIEKTVIYTISRDYP